MCHIDWFADVPSLRPWNKSYLIMVYNPFNVLLNLGCFYFIMIFASMFIRDISL